MLVQIQFRKIPVGGDVGLEGLVCRTGGFSGAEVKELMSLWSQINGGYMHMLVTLN